MNEEVIGRQFNVVAYHLTVTGSNLIYEAMVNENMDTRVLTIASHYQPIVSWFQYMFTNICLNLKCFL